MNKVTSPVNPFSTYAVGSLPRPQWVRDVIEDRKSGLITPDASDKQFDAAIPSAVLLQERAGLDYISDGEWRRESYIKVFCEHVSGFRTDVLPMLLVTEAQGARISATGRDPVVVDRLVQESELTTDAARFLRAQTDRRTIVAVPSPYILGWRMWNAEHSRDAYSTREEFMEACVPILRDELSSLEETGIDHVQIDEPWLLMLVDPDHRARLGITDLDNEIELCIRMVNAVLEGAGGLRTSMHMCHAHFDRQRATDGSYELLIDALAEINVGRFAMEFAAPESHGVEILERFPKDKVLGLGVIDHCNPNVETPELVVKRTEAALEYVPLERVTLNPDCGFSPGSHNPMDLDEAYLKLTAMCLAADMLRKKYA